MTILTHIYVEPQNRLRTELWSKMARAIANAWNGESTPRRSMLNMSFRSLPTYSVATPSSATLASCTFLFDMQHARPSYES